MAPCQPKEVAFLCLIVYNLCKENDMKKQLECELHCQATASLREGVVKDMAQEDRPLQELLDESKDDEEDSHRELPNIRS